MTLTTQRASLVTLMSPEAHAKAQRPPLDPILITARSHGRHHHHHTTSLVSPSPPNTPSQEPSRQSSPSRRRSLSRRQSSISYLPADSPRLWAPRSPEKKRTSTLKRSVSLNNKKEARASTGSIPQRPTHTPAVLTLAERHAELLQFIAQKESKCLELRSQLTAHESELHELKRKWERIIHREFGRNLSTTSPSAPPLASPQVSTGGGAVPAGGVRARPAATSSPIPASPLARRMARQAASNSFSSTTTTTSSSAASTGAGTRLSQSSVSSVGEAKNDMLEEPIVRDTVVAQQRPSSPSVKTLRRRSRESSVPLSDALSSLTGVGTSSKSMKRASLGAVPPASIPGINSLGAMGLGRTNIGEAAQGLMDSVGSRLAELQRGQTFSKSQKRASVLFSEVSQSIYSALAPASPAPSAPKAVLPTSPMQSLIDDDDEVGSTILGHAILPDTVAISRRPTPSEPSPLSRPETKDDEDDEDWNW